ncbi:hypothetical protein [Streptomyces sp. NPDC059874]|uniref:hypothetical protein n=1 Tax=Streptomyces sp. NPDC059874 TaxID=3346983 RepID=UPI0036661A3D
MDDLIGTQVPRQRLTDPASAVAALEQAVPGLALLRRTAPAGIDWALVEECLNTKLPSDYKLLANSYPEESAADTADELVARGRRLGRRAEDAVEHAGRVGLLVGQRVAGHGDEPVVGARRVELLLTSSPA